MVDDQGALRQMNQTIAVMIPIMVSCRPCRAGIVIYTFRMLGEINDLKRIQFKIIS